MANFSVMGAKRVGCVMPIEIAGNAPTGACDYETSFPILLIY